MTSATFTVRVNADTKDRLERLARSTGRSRSWLTADALREYLDANEWQIAGIRRAIDSMDRGKGTPHGAVRDWVSSWGSRQVQSPRKR
jgi:predicted transcriptional regulator